MQKHPQKRRTAKRVLIVQYSANLDGSAVSALMVADGLRENGWETHVAFAFQGPIIDRFRERNHCIHIVPHKSWLRSEHHLPFAKRTSQELRSSGVFCSVIDEVEPSVVYVNTAVSLAGARAAYQRGIPCVWHVRELLANVGGEMRVPMGMKPWMRSRFNRYADAIVANSRSVARNMLGKRLKRRVEIIPNAVENHFFNYVGDVTDAREKLTLPIGSTIIGVPGTLRPMKGHPFFFEAVRRLMNEFPDLTVAVTGSGEKAYVDSLRVLIHEMGLERRVIFLGSIADMPAFLCACDLVCIPSVAEPFGRTVIEAFAMGTPLVATAVGGIPEIVDDEANGLLVPYGHHDMMARSLRRLILDDALRQRLSANAVRKATAEYHERIYKERTCRVVDRATRRKAGAVVVSAV